MARVWGLIVLCMAAGEWTLNSAKLYECIHRILELRHKLQADPDRLRADLCGTEKINQVDLFWNETGQWIEVCESPKKTGYLPRIWRITLTHNYRMLFLREVPITFAIVIKR